MEYHCFLCCCVYPTVINFIVSEHIEPVCFLSHFIEMKVQLYKTLFLIRIFRKTVRQEQIQDTKSTRKRTSVFTTELNERVHESKQCIPSLFTYIELKVPSGSFFGKIVFTSRTTRANPVLKSSISNWRLSRQCFRTELNERVYHKVESSVQNTNRICFATELNESCSSIKLACSLSLWLCPSYWTESSTEQRYIQGLRDERYRPVNAQ